MGYKHMSHMYENPDLKFSQIKDIFIKASEGKLEGTEKTDGQNMLVSYSVVEGRARAARNNSMLSGIYHVKGRGKVRRHAPGGVDAAGWADKWAEHPSGTVRDAFVEAFSIFESSVQSLTPEEQEQVFGDGVSYLVFYNCEVQDPRNMNTIRYDKKTLTIHRVGHLYVDLSDGKVKEDIDVTRHAYALQNSLRNMQKSIENKQFALEVNAIRQLKGLNDKKALNTALEELEREINSIGLSDSHSIGDYTIKKLLSMIRPYIRLPEDKENMLLKKILGHKGLNINLIKKDLPPGEKEIVNRLYSDRRMMMSTAIRPIESIIHDFAVEILKAFESAFVLNQDEEIQRLRSTVEKKVSEIEASDQESHISTLMKNMEKIKNFENISTAAEGFVFDYDGHTYKFTGNFAPINQILGIGKYDRGSDLASKIGESTIINERENRIIALIPGAFKPPQDGHLNMVKHYAKHADTVKVMVSILPRISKDKKIEINADQSMAIWNIYIRDSGLENVEILRSPSASPVGATYDFVSNNKNNPEWAQPGDRIILGASTKGGDESRFAGDVQAKAREGVEVLDPLDYIYKVTSDAPLHGSDFRNALAADQDILRFLPDESIRAGSEQEILSVLKPDREKKTPIMEFLFSLVEQVLNEVETEKQRKWACAQMGDNRKEFKGKIKLSPKQAKEMCKSEPQKEGYGEGTPPKGAFYKKQVIELEEEELEEISASAGGAVEGAPGKRKNSGLIREKDAIIKEVYNTIINGGGIEYGTRQEGIFR